MSIEHLTAKANCVVWRNIQLPHPNRNRKSPVFNFQGLNWQFEIHGSFYSNLEEWNFIFNKPSGPDSFNIIPYLKTEGGYIRVSTKICRLNLASTPGIDTDKITVLFYFQPEYLNFSLLDFKETSTEVLDANVSGEESIQSLCLESLSKDIVHLFDQDEFADVTLKCGEKIFSVHRNILAARSEVFSAMFKHNMSEKNNGVANIIDVDSDILELFLRYLYSGKVREMSMDIAVELYKVANKYAVFTLKKLCASYILDNLSENIVCKVLQLADEASDKEFLNSIATFAARKEGFLKSIEWKDFAEKFSNIAIKVYFKCYA